MPFFVMLVFQFGINAVHVNKVDEILLLDMEIFRRTHDLHIQIGFCATEGTSFFISSYLFIWFVPTIFSLFFCLEYYKLTVDRRGGVEAVIEEDDVCRVLEEGLTLAELFHQVIFPAIDAVAC